MGHTFSSGHADCEICHEDCELYSLLLQIDGYRVFSAQGPQPYALAVLGKFSGVLAGPSNPVNGASASPGDCSIVAAQITSAPPSLTNSTYELLQMCPTVCNAQREFLSYLHEDLIRASFLQAFCERPEFRMIATA